MAIGKQQGFKFSRGGRELGDIIVESIDLGSGTTTITTRFGDDSRTHTLSKKEFLEVPGYPIDVALQKVCMGKREPVAYLFIRSNLDVDWAKYDYACP